MSKQLSLLWQDIESRSWYHIGDLKFADGMYVFSYDHSSKEFGLKNALEIGYKPHPTFPDMDKIYTSEKLFSAFARRLPNRSRKDYNFIFENFDLEDGDLDLLQLTGGVLYADSYEFVEPIQERDGYFEIDCFLRAWRHYNPNDMILDENDQLVLKVDTNNEFDKNAVQVFDIDQNRVIGYLPSYYAGFVKNLILKNVEITVDYEFLADATPQYKVRLSLSGELPQALTYILTNDSFSLI